MNQTAFEKRVNTLFDEHEQLVTRRNVRIERTNGVFHRYQYPVLTNAHTPIFWRYDLDDRSNPHLCERLGVNSAFNVGAIELDGRTWCMRCVRVLPDGAASCTRSCPTSTSPTRSSPHPKILSSRGTDNTPQVIL